MGSSLNHFPGANRIAREHPGNLDSGDLGLGFKMNLSKNLTRRMYLQSREQVIAQFRAGSAQRGRRISHVDLKHFPIRKIPSERKESGCSNRRIPSAQLK
jgi:hypothetical protein